MSSTPHPAIGTTDELELQPVDLTLSPITPQEDLNDFKLCSELKLPPDQCIKQLWDLPTLFHETSTTTSAPSRIPPPSLFAETPSLFNESEKKQEKKENPSTKEEEEEGSLSIPKLVRQSHSEPCPPLPPPIYLVSMTPLQDDLWDRRSGVNAWDMFVRETKTGQDETKVIPYHAMKRNMRIAMINCAYQISGCELLSEFRLCLHKWLILPQFEDYDSIEAKLLSGDIKTVGELCEEFSAKEGARILEGIYKTHHTNLNEFHLS